jgi:3-dehydroquinate synthase
MRSIKVNLGLRSYPIYIGTGVLAICPAWLKKIRGGLRLYLVTNPTVFELYGYSLKENLQTADFEVTVLTVPEGEQYKSLDNAARLYNELSQSQAGRNTPMLALGGGVIGDLAGFVASTYMRGIPLIHLPTTLVAQVDSAIGGKTAVNNGKFKNQVGTFYQPRAVFSDTYTLKSLASKDIANGLAEIIKCAVIRDPALFSFLEKNMDRIKMGDGGALERVIVRTASIKADIVSRDEQDLGLRNMLNFGHTVGHALEAVSGFQMNHGEAVALGMLAAARISQRLKLFSVSDFDRLVQLISQAGLPISMPEFDINEVIEAIKHDKKVTNGKLRFILPLRIGCVVISEKVELAMIAEVLSES